MLPAYRIEVLEYLDFDEDPQGIRKSKPHIIFEDKKYIPLAELLNWSFPNTEALTVIHNYLLRPWHPDIKGRGISVLYNSFTDVTPDGKVIIRQDPDEGSEIEISLTELLDAYSCAILISQNLSTNSI